MCLISRTVAHCLLSTPRVDLSIQASANLCELRRLIGAVIEVACKRERCEDQQHKQHHCPHRVSALALM